MASAEFWDGKGRQWESGEDQLKASEQPRASTSSDQWHLAMPDGDGGGTGGGAYADSVLSG